MLGGRRCSVMQNEGLVWEVLLRLPTNSLMRFKRVSKLWYSIIRNPKFAIAYSNIDVGGCFRGLLISGDYHNGISTAHKYFYVKLNDFPRWMRLHFSFEFSILFQKFKDFTRPVKGLMGLYKDDINEFTLCNIATHELLELPPSPSSNPTKNMYHYDIGFDPVKEVYKVLNGRLCYDERDNFIGHQNHVFTLGVDYSDLNWRDIAPAPSSDLYHQPQQCLCINGTMYWLPQEDHVQEYLTAFHLNNETFETIKIPDSENDVADLVEICGSLALVVIDTSTTEYLQMLDIWTMNNPCREGELEAWTRKRVGLTMSLDIPDSLYYAATLPTGDMVLADRDSYNFPCTIYIVDHLKNEVNSVILECPGLESDVDYHNTIRLCTMVCYYEENIISLHSLMSNHE